MRVIRHLSQARPGGRPNVVALGNFDGVHRGHQELIRRAVEGAGRCGGVPVALTFHPHPAAVLAPERAPSLLATPRQRIELLAARGIETVIMQHFTRRFADVEAEDFVREYLMEKLRVREVVVGYNVGFGKGRGGSAALLRALGQECGFRVEVVGGVTVEGLAVSSSAVRAAVACGDLRSAGVMLGRPYCVCGRVVHGHHRGRKLGFPTANLRPRGIQLPPDGVYAVRVRVGADLHGGIANIGFNPTFRDTERAVEAHLFDFDADLYGRRVEVTFVKQLRAERRFPELEALSAQIRRDVIVARRILQVS